MVRLLSFHSLLPLPLGELPLLALQGRLSSFKQTPSFATFGVVNFTKSRLHFPNQSADLVACRIPLADLPQPLVFLREVRRILSPHGLALLIAKGEPDRQIANLILAGGFSRCLIKRRLGAVAILAFR